MALFFSLLRLLGLSRPAQQSRKKRPRINRFLQLEPLEARELLNAAPILPVLDDRVFSHTQNLSITLNASDPDGDAITYNAGIQGYSQAYDLKTSLVLKDPGSNFFFNTRGMGEKYLTGGTQAYYLLSTGGLYKWGGSIAASTLLATLDPSFYVNPSLLVNAPAPTTPPVSVSVTGNQLTIFSSNYAGTFLVEVDAGDGLHTTSRVFKATSTDASPALAGISDLTLSHSLTTLPTVTLQGTDADTSETLTFSAQVFADSPAYRAYQVDQSKGIYDPGSNYFFNTRGQNEKYLLGAGGICYFIMPTGALYQWGTSLANSTLLTTLDSSYWANPSLVWNAQTPAALTGYTSVTGNQLNFTNQLKSFSGTMVVQASVTDGIASAAQTFKVTITNSTPTLAGLSDLTLSHAPASLPTITLQGTDADTGDTLTYGAQVYADSPAYRAYQYDQSRGIYDPGSNYYFNTRGQNEKYLLGTGGICYFLLPTGALYQWGTTLANSTLLTTLDSSFWANPSRVWNAQAPVALTGYTSLTGNQLSFTNQLKSFAGTMVVQAGVTDGSASATQSFKVTVTNSAPVLPAMNNLTVPHQQGISLTLSGTDADPGDTLTYSAQAQGYSAAYDLVQKYGLTDPGANYYFNAHGANEKWMTGTNGIYALLPNGELHAWTGTAISPVVLGTPGISYYANPKLLMTTPAPAAPPVTVNVTGNHIVLNTTSYMGTFRVVVNALDGIATTSQTFLATITDTAPTLAVVPSQNVSHTQGPIVVNLAGSDADSSDALTYSAQLIGNPPVVLSTTGNKLTITPAANYTGTFQVQATVSDGVYTAQQSFSVTVTDKAPVLTFIPDRSISHTQEPISVSLSATDADNDPLTYSLQLQGNPPVVVIQSGNQFTLTPAANYIGLIQVQATVSDGIISTQQIFNLTITDNAPVLNFLPNLSVPHTQGPVSVTPSATDADGDPLTYGLQLVGNPPVALTQSGNQYTLTPASTYVGSFQVLATVSDGLVTTSQTFTVTVTDNAPVLQFIADKSVSHTQGAIGVTMSATDADGDPLTYGAQLIGNPAVTLTRSGNQLTLTPAANYTGTFQVQVSVSDGLVTTSQTFNVSVTDYAPVLQFIADKSVSHTQGAIGVTMSATDADADPLTYSAQLIGNPAVNLTRSGNQLTLAPAANYAGTFQVQVSVGDGFVTTSQTFSVTVTDNAPVLQSIPPQSVMHGTGPIVVNLSATDADGDPLTYSAQLIGNPGVTLTRNGNQITLTPAANYVGTFQVQATVSDGMLTGVQTFQGSVIDNAPVLQAIPDQSVPHTLMPIVVNLSASDADSDPLTYSAQLVGAPPVSLVRTGSQITLTPAANYLGNFQVTVSVSDGLLTSSKTFQLTVTNAAPVLQAIANQTVSHSQGPLVTSLSATDADNDVVTYTAQALNGAPVALNISGNQLTVTPASSYLGMFQVQVTASDGFGGASSQIFQGTVTNVAPGLAVISDQTMAHQLGSLTLHLPGTDADNDPLTYSATVRGYSKAYDFLQQYGGFISAGTNYYFNSHGLSEKWLIGANNLWYTIMPGGDVHAWTGTAIGPTLTTLDSSYYANPLLLINATAPSAPPVTVSVTDSQLTVSPSNGYLGTFKVDAQVSDPFTSTSRTFLFTVTNTAPVLARLPEQALTTSQSQITVPLSAVDAEADPITYTAQVVGYSQAYSLKTSLGLTNPGFNFYFNTRGQGEKYLTGANNLAYFLLPTGAIYQFGTSIANSTLVATLDAAYYVNPTLILNAAAPTPPPVSVSVNGNQLTITPTAGYLGTFRVNVTSADPYASTTSSFLTTVAKASVTAMSPDTGVTGDHVTTANQLTFSGQGTAGLAFTLLLDGQLQSSLQVGSNGTWSVNLPQILSDGAHQIKVVPQDGSTTDTFNFTIDRTGPQITLSPQLAIAGAAIPVQVQATDVSGVAGQIAFDVDLNGNGSFSDPGEQNFYTTSLTNGAGTVNLPYLGVGNHAIRARMTDLAGNEGTSATATVVGPTADTVQLQVPANTSSTVYQAQVAVTAGVRNGYQMDVHIEVDLQHNGQFVDYADGTLDASGNANISFYGLIYGNYQVRARIEDMAGNATYSPVQNMAVSPTVGGGAPLSFQPNQGQALNNQVQFMSRGQNYSAFLEPTLAAVYLPGPISSTDATQVSWLQQIQLVNSNPSAIGTPSVLMPGYTNYIGNGGQINGVANYGAVTYKNVYPGIDWNFSLSQNNLEFNFTVNPGADPSNILINLPNATGLSINANGQLVLTQGNGQTVTLTAPLTYQTVGAVKVAIPSRWVLMGGNQVGFAVGNYDHSKALVIDPYVFQAFVGTVAADTAGSVAVDNSGNIWVIFTAGAAGNFANPALPFAGGTDACIVKMNSSGSAVLATTFLGGTGNDTGRAIAIAPNGSPVVTGMGNPALGFPLTFPFNIYPSAPGVGGGDVYICRLSSTGGLLLTTILGGTNADEGEAIALDGFGNAFVAGKQGAGGFFFNAPNGNEGFTGGGFVAEVNTLGNVVYSHQMGMVAADFPTAIAVDDFGSAYVTGTTTNIAWNFSPGVPNALRALGGNVSAAFVVKLNANGVVGIPAAIADANGFTGYSILLAGTPSVAGTNANTGFGIAVDTTLNAYVVGSSTADRFPFPLAFGGDGAAVGADQRNPFRNDADVFVAKIAPSGLSLVFFSTLNNNIVGLLGAANESAQGVAVDTQGRVYVYGTWTGATTFFPLVNPLTSYQGGASDAFVAVFNAAGNALISSSSVGGGGVDAPPVGNGNGIALAANGDIIVTGKTTASASFPNPKNGVIFGTAAFGGAAVYVDRISLFPTTFTNDAFETNEVADQAASLNTLNKGRPLVIGNLNTAFHSDGSPDYDWFSLTMGASGTLEVDLLDIQVFASGPNSTFGAPGDLNLRLFRQDGGDLTDMAPPNGYGDPGYLLNSGFQTVIISVNAGDTIFIDVNPFNFSQATYALRAILT